MKVLRSVFLLAAIAGAGNAFGAEESAKQRIAELSKPASDEIVITAGGDTIWNRKLSPADEAQASSLFDLLRGSDVAFVNHEQILADHGYPAQKAIAKADPSIIDEVSRAGINLVSLANNHDMDFGIPGIETTRRTLDAHGIKYAGVGMDLDDALKPAIIEKKGLKIALLAFMVTPNFPDLTIPATEHGPGAAPIHGAKIRLPDGKVVFSPWEDDLKRMETAIASAKKEADVVLVSFHIHWGGPAQEVDPTGKQVIAHAAIKAGADAVLGHGPQAINGMEFYEGKPIFYSLGTFFWQFDYDRYDLFPDIQKAFKGLTGNPLHYQSLVMRMALSPKGQIRRIELLPIQLNDQGNPHLAFGKEGEPMLNQMQSLSQSLGTTITRKSWYAVAEVPAP